MQESLCGDGCALNDQEVGNQGCDLQTIIKNGTAVVASRSDPTGQYKNWYTQPLIPYFPEHISY